MSWRNQSITPDTRVEVSGDNYRDGRERTDFLVIDRASGHKTHLSIGSEPGSELVQQQGPAYP